MILAVNASNSLAALGLYDKGELRAKAMFSSQDRMSTSHEYSYKLASFLSFEGYAPENVEGAIIAPVNPGSSASIAEAVRLVCGVSPLAVGPGIRTGLEILLKDPTAMGADLVAASVAALEKHKPPIVMVIIGATALVIAAINAKGQYMGGTIAPGPRLALSALCESAAYLPSMVIEQPGKLIGSDTREALSSGLVYGTAAMVRGMVEMIVDKIAGLSHNKVASVVITGSVAPDIVPHIGLKAEFDANLILDGLNILYHRNRRG